jgi:hypothetical protein
VGTTGSGGASVKTPGAGLTGTATLLAGSAWWRARVHGEWRNTFAHHPDAPAFAHDVFHVAGLRLCVGCTTVLPAFLLPSAWLALFPLAPWWAGLAAGVPLAFAQAISSAGWARLRWQKAVVKTCLGIGLALVVSAVLSSPWQRPAKVAVLLALLGLAWASTWPRRRRLGAWSPDRS